MSPPLLYGVWVSALSVLTFAAYGCDKWHAVRRRARVPELTLHLLALAGGFPGGWLGRWVFRHKTRKLSFGLVLALSTLLHLSTILWLQIKF